MLDDAALSLQYPDIFQTLEYCITFQLHRKFTSHSTPLFGAREGLAYLQNKYLLCRFAL